MRQFLLLGHRVPTTPEFSLDALPSDAGRLDVLCRAVSAAFVLSHDIREDVRVHLVLQDEFTITFEGADLRNLNPDERSTAALIRTALEHREDAIGHVAAESSPGVSISRKGLETTLAEAAEDSTVVCLHEDGDPIVDVDPPEDSLFVLSDHESFTDAEAALVDEHADHRCRLSPRALHADHAVTVAHNYLDTDGFRRF
ncbi:tRNA (pseudouridine(54)-N(1))-methyltransferase TrmY [Halorientalis halophila]|uniref:tRNA (pseudouridine(54)-N(1))-methyltransferase TrmY n=1 Tax=Halorientalis halophila TaxID=3108499 RepID=UPI00300A5E48